MGDLISCHAIPPLPRDPDSLPLACAPAVASRRSRTTRTGEPRPTRAYSGPVRTEPGGFPANQHRGRAADQHTHTETTETTGTDTTAGIAAARVGHREAVRGRVHHHRRPSAGRRRAGPHHRGGPAAARRRAAVLRPRRGGDSRHRRLLPAPYRPVLPRDPSPTCTRSATPAPPTAPSSPAHSPACRSRTGEDRVPHPGQRRRRPRPPQPHPRGPRVHPDPAPRRAPGPLATGSAPTTPTTPTPAGGRGR